MASSSSSSSRNWRYNVFASFHGPDVRKSFVSHLRKQFSCNGISMFDDQGIERSQVIAPALTEAISESKISVVVLSKNYASSRWCLDELVEILKRRGKIVMTIFYGVDPSDVRKQTGEFGRVFNGTCARRTKEERRRWSQALSDVGNIAGEHFLNWENESKMIEKIARDVSNKLNATVSRDFEDIVGIEAHLEKMQSLLHLDYEDEAMIVGICGPAGIGKTTIARALYSRLYSSFPLTCFMENLRGSYNRGLDEIGLKLSLQGQLLSKILNQDGIKIHHLGAIPERLCDQKVLIILDDVDDLKQLEALANEANWFGPGSRIIVTTEDQELLEQQDINNTYHVDFPTKEEASEILSRYAFRRSLAPDGFEKLAERVTKLCSNLPLGLRVMGSSLRRKKAEDWEDILHRLESSLDQDIKKVLRVGYDSLYKDDQFLFLLIACFLNYQDKDSVKAMLGDSKLKVRLGLKTLAYKSLIQLSSKGTIVMHKLLQQVGREAIQIQEPTKRQILIDTDEICDVLGNDSDITSVMGISLDVSTIPNEVYIRAQAFKNMRSLRFLSIYESKRDPNVKVHVPDDIEFSPRLRLLHWEVYPGKCLPNTLRPEYLVELNLQNNQLEKLWEGTQHLTSLKKMDLSGSLELKELPDVSNATNLERLILNGCWSLVEIPSSIGYLQKLESLEMNCCLELQAVPTLSNLASLESVRMVGCSQLRKIPDISTNITSLVITDTMLEELPESPRLWSRLQNLSIYGSIITLSLSALPTYDKRWLERNRADIERIPDWIKDLHGLNLLYIAGCPKLVSLPELPSSLRRLTVETCESLETVFDSMIGSQYFPNCFKLGVEARRVITERSFYAYLPGRTIPAEFDHRAIGNSMTIRPAFCKFRFCLVLSPKPEMEEEYVKLFCRMHIKGSPGDENMVEVFLRKIRAEHLFIFHAELLEQHKELSFKFTTSSHEVEVTECGVQVMLEETNENVNSCGSCESRSEKVCEDDDECLSDGTYNEIDAARVKMFKGYGMVLSLVFIFLLSVISSVLLYSFLKKH